MAADSKLPRSDEKALGRLARQVRELVGQRPARLSKFALQLEAAFQPWLELTEPAPAEWFATLDVLSPHDNQVAAVVKLSHQRPSGDRTPKVRRGTVEVEERNRKLFAEPVPTASSANADLLLTYSFPLFLSLNKNLDLFREFASNELCRLRGESTSEVAGRARPHVQRAAAAPARVR
jgi:hypothetical protein